MINFSSNVLPQGIPLIVDYTNLTKTSLFLEMESFSNNFLKTHAKALKKYRWVADPFHQWSRQWEYPFAYSYIRQFITSTSKFIPIDDEIRILDAGSGCTFFPYYLSYKHPNCRVYCCDHDSSLAPIFMKINQKRNANVEFNTCNLANLRYEDNFFDILYCISVLEHTHDHVDIIKQFNRVLKHPTGLLIITFDISLDNKAGIDLAQDTLNKINNEFKGTHLTIFELLKDIQKHDIVTTEFARKFDKKLLPWKLTWKSFLGQLLKLKRPKRQFHTLTIFCGVWKKDEMTTHPKS
mgnify:CR=1 FL=1